jgi:APA family basic amino acid/polyamine antiporter
LRKAFPPHTLFAMKDPMPASPNPGPSGSSLPGTNRPGLLRGLGPLMAMAVVVGTVIGSGIFKKPQAVAESVPFFGEVLLVWTLGGVLAILGALALAEVAVLYPRAGGNYVFLREGYGPLFGFLWGWVEFWIIRGGSLAALATIFTESFHDILRETAGTGAGSDVLSYWEQKLLTVAIILGLALVNVRGVRWGGLLQLLITLVKVGSLLGIAILPFVVLALGRPESASLPTTANLTPVWPTGDTFHLGGLITALLGVLWAYHGWMNVVPVAEEIRNPQRNIPLALIGGTVLVMILYLGANLAYCLVIPQERMAEMTDASGKKPATKTAATDSPAVHDNTVVIGFSRRLLGSVGVGLAAAALMFSVFGALNGNLLVGPRLLYAMGEDGLAPRALGAVHPRYRTPALAIVVMAGWAALLILAVASLTDLDLLPRRQSHFDILTNFAMFGSVTFETLAVTTIFVFRRRLPDAPRSYRCWGYPVVPALYVLIIGLVLVNMFFNQRTEALVGVGFIALGAGVYFATVGRGKKRLVS